MDDHDNRLPVTDRSTQDIYRHLFQKLPTPSFLWQKKNGDLLLIDYTENAPAYFDKSDSPFQGRSSRDLLKQYRAMQEDLEKCATYQLDWVREYSFVKAGSEKTERVRVSYKTINQEIILVQIQELAIPGESHSANTSALLKFLAASPAALAVVDKQMRYLAVSDKWIHDYNLTGEELIGKSHYEIFPEIGPEWKKIHQECLKGKNQKREEDPFIRQDGSIDWIRWEIRPWYEDNGQVGGIILFTELITEKKRIEAELKNQVIRSEANEAKLIEAQAVSKLGSWETNLLDLTVNWSHETYRIFELDPRTFQPTHESFLEFVHPEDRNLVNQKFLASFHSRDYHSIEHRIITANGNIKIVEERWKIIWDESNNPIRTFGTCQDITERKSIEQELLITKKLSEDNEQRLTLAAEAAELGVWD